MRRLGALAGALCALVALEVSAAAGQRLLEVKSRTTPTPQTDQAPVVVNGCFCPELGDVMDSPLGLEREQPWSLPRRALSAAAPRAFNVLVLRVSFPEESPDNQLTTGNGRMDFRTFDEFVAQYGHEIDPAPHDSLYFDAHMRALSFYYSFVSRGAVTMSWDVWPPGDTMTYETPREMAYYGDPNLVEERLTDFFVDCIHTADSVSPEIVFSDYNAIIIFHAGADRQNDIGFPETPYDLFTGFIKSAVSVSVDGGDTTISQGMFMPEQASQDNRAVALNAVMAHEFAHVLGLVDLYSTRNFFTQLGDFALMDNNGFGTGLDFGFPGVLNTFGAIPVYLSAWSRAYLGFDEVVELPPGTPLAVVAASLDTLVNSSSGGKIIKVPISRYEYYLIENRQQITSQMGGLFGSIPDSATGVLLGPGYELFVTQERVLSGDYDFLLPGNGLLIYHVDESVAFGDVDGDGQPNFSDNDLQWDPERRFIRLVEADGYIDFGGRYFKGFGSQGDYWTPSTYNEFTSNTNPATVTSTGAHTHLSITVDSATGLDHQIYVSGDNDRVVGGFPVWTGVTVTGHGPIAADIDGAPGEEIIVASWNRLIVTAADGGPGWRFNPPQVRDIFIANTFDTLDYFIGGDSTAELAQNVYPINLFAELPGQITGGPVVGAFNDTTFIAVTVGDTLYLFGTEDSNPFGARQPDSVWKFDFRAEYLAVAGAELKLFAIDAEATLNGFAPGALSVVANPGIEPYGVCVAGGIVTTLNENVNQQRFELRNSAGAVYPLAGVFSSGPVSADLNRDGRPEYVVAEADGRVVIVSQGSAGPSSYELFASAATERAFMSDPVISDVDSDGYPDILISGAGVVHGFNQQLSNLVGFPWPIDRDFAAALPTGPALVADVSLDSEPDVIVAVEALDSLAGSVYALGNGVQFGFPLPGGGAPQGAPVIVDNNGPQTIAYLGRDGFMYNWKINSAAGDVQWRMFGADAGGTNSYDAAALPAPKPLSGGIDEDNFYCYPNPVMGASATVRYTLGRSAERVRLMILDLSGQIIREFSGAGTGGFANEVAIDCSGMVPGVYRVRLEASFGGDTETAFTDIAVAH